MVLVRSRRVVFPGRVDAASLEIRDGKIVAIGPFDRATEGAQVVDLGDKYILPGLVDTHVHINEPGRSEWEGFRTATRAAAAGGYTTLVDMPLNNLPETTTVPNLHLKQAAACRQCTVDYGFWGGVVADNQQHVRPLASAGVLGYKCFLVHPGIDGFTMVTRAQLEAAMPEVAATGLPLLVHAELPEPIEQATARLNDARCDWKRYSTYLASRPDAAEVEAIRLMIGLSRKYRCRVHIVHLSSVEALPDLHAAREEGLPITVETCPHYLHFTAEGIADGATLCKCAPPIRSRENRERLWQALRDGVIDLVATDHSPCPPFMKQLETGNFKTAWGGIASLSIALPVMWTEANRRGFTLRDVARWMAERPAELAGCGSRKGRIAAGCDADLVVFEPETEFTVTPERLHYRHAVSAYMGEKLRGVVKATYLRGKRVFAEGAFPGGPIGREYRS